MANRRYQNEAPKVGAHPTEQNEAPKAGAHAAEQEDLSFLIWRHIFQAIVANEKRAAESGTTIQFEVEVAQHSAGSRTPIVRIEVVCEPGKPSRSVSVRAK